MLWEWVNSGTQVFILDLDGTLMPSAEIDNLCFWEAVFECFGERDGLPDLHHFKHVTDTGILEEWCVHELGRSPLDAETRQIKQRFGQLLESAFALEPRHFEPLAGVCDWLDTATLKDNVYVGVATGGWQHSALLKLRLSGLDRFELPVASSDDAISRTEIMQIAAQRTLGNHADLNAHFTYIGDGAWDLQASSELGWKFIGIADDEPAQQLRRAGADHILRNFSNN